MFSIWTKGKIIRRKHAIESPGFSDYSSTCVWLDPRSCRHHGSQVPFSTVWSKTLITIFFNSLHLIEGGACVTDMTFSNTSIIIQHVIACIKIALELKGYTLYTPTPRGIESGSARNLKGINPSLVWLKYIKKLNNAEKCNLTFLKSIPPSLIFFQVSANICLLYYTIVMVIDFWYRFSALCYELNIATYHRNKKI